MCQYSIVLTFLRTLGFALSSQSHLSGVSYSTLIRASCGADMRPSTWSRFAEWLISEGLAVQYDPTATCLPPAQRRCPEWLNVLDGRPLLSAGERVLAVPGPSGALLIVERVVSKGLYAVEQAFIVPAPLYWSVEQVLELAADKLQERLTLLN